MCLFFSACAKGGADKRGIRIYYLNKADYGIKEQEYVPEANDRDRIIEELIAKLCVQPKEMTLRAPISGFRLLSSETKGRIVTLNFSGEYYDLSAVEEVLTRTAVVNTMCSFAEVDGVYFLVEGEAFHDADAITRECGFICILPGRRETVLWTHSGQLYITATCRLRESYWNRSYWDQTAVSPIPPSTARPG